MRLTDIPLDRPVATFMLLLSLTVLGTVAVFLLPLDFMPVVNEPEIDIEIPFPGSHPLEALREVIDRARRGRLARRDFPELTLEVLEDERRPRRA